MNWNIYVCVGKSYVLVAGHNYTVGRKDKDIAFPGNISVSRDHAVITVHHPSANLVSVCSKDCLIPTAAESRLKSAYFGSQCVHKSFGLGSLFLK